MNDYTKTPQSEISDGIDLFEIYNAVWRQRYIVAGVVVLFGLMALAFSFTIAKVYEVNSVLRTTAINELDALNRSEIYKLPPNEALLKVAYALSSYETRLGFFNENIALFDNYKSATRKSDQKFQMFNWDSITIGFPDPKAIDMLGAAVKIKFNYPKDVAGADILNKFVEYAVVSERAKITTDLKVIIQNRLRELDGKLSAARASYDIDKAARVASLLEADTLKRAQLQDELKALRLQLKTTRSDRVTELNEAIGIARALGIKKPSTPSSLADADRSGMGNVIRTEVNSQQIPLYFMGTEVLEAERETLLQRKSDDFTENRIAQIAKELQLLQVNREAEVLSQRKNEDVFLLNVQPLRSEMARLRDFNTDVSNLKLVTVDQIAVEPTGPIKPNKVLVVFIGLVMGLVVGVILAVLRHALTK